MSSLKDRRGLCSWYPFYSSVLCFTILHSIWLNENSLWSNFFWVHTMICSFFSAVSEAIRDPYRPEYMLIRWSWTKMIYESGMKFSDEAKCSFLCTPASNLTWMTDIFFSSNRPGLFITALGYCGSQYVLV